MSNEYGQLYPNQEFNGAYSYFLEKFLDKVSSKNSPMDRKTEILEYGCDKEDPGIIEKAKVHLRNFINEK